MNRELVSKETVLLHERQSGVWGSCPLNKSGLPTFPHKVKLTFLSVRSETKGWWYVKTNYNYFKTMNFLILIVCLVDNNTIIARR